VQRNTCRDAVRIEGTDSRQQRRVQIGTMHVIKRYAITIATLVLRQRYQCFASRKVTNAACGRIVADLRQSFAEPECDQRLAGVWRDAQTCTHLAQGFDLFEYAYLLTGTQQTERGRESTDTCTGNNDRGFH
jgi:hypothetical protein